MNQVMNPSSELLRLPLLRRFADALQIGELGSVRWIDLYAAQYVADVHCEGETRSGGESQQLDAMAALALGLSLATTRGKTHMRLSDLPQLITSVHWDETAWRACLSESPAVHCLEAAIVVEASGQAAFDFDADTDTNAETSTQTSDGSSIDKTNQDAPITVADDAVYLTRYWRLTSALNVWLDERLSRSAGLTERQLGIFRDELQDLFDLSHDAAEIDTPDQQACAAALALIQPVSLISGGPGTGKTTTAGRILSLLMRQFELNEGRAPKVRLLAPTGKAAVRLAQSIKQYLAEQPEADAIPEYGETVHRFIYRAMQQHESGTQRHLMSSSQRAQTAVDIVLIDEASMIDLSLMVSLTRCLPAHCRVVFLGDHHQLPAIAPGQVFSDWVQHYETLVYSTAQIQSLTSLLGPTGAHLKGGADKPNPLCVLTKTYRFGGALKQCAEDIKQGNVDEFISFLRVESEPSVVRWCQLSDSNSMTMLANILSPYNAYVELVQGHADVHALQTVFADFQILCSTQEGEWGVKRLNQLIEGQLTVGEAHYHGRPILVTENHPDLGVFNGDVGFVIQEPAGFFVAFSQPDGEIIRVAPASLRAWQPAFAMTVHKSQGSEFAHVSLVLADYVEELLTRAMLYTGLTRAKARIDICASERGIRVALANIGA